MLKFNISDTVFFEHAGRAVTQVYESAEIDIMVVGWEPGQNSSRHDHGRSESVVCVLEGIILVNAGTDSELTLCQGDVCVTPIGEIHQLTNIGGIRAVTLHLYAPPLYAREISQPFKKKSK